MTFHMTDAERHLAKEFHLHPQEARALDQLREAVGYCPDEMVVPTPVYRSANYRHNVISRLRRKLRGSGIVIAKVPGGYRLEAA